MPKSPTATWSIVLMVPLWACLAQAEPPEFESVPITVSEGPAAEEREGTVPVAGQEKLHGVVIEEISKDSTLGRVGLQAGDVITSWKRLPNPPANPEVAEGAMTSFFDWQELEVEQAPRGTVVLRGRRGKEPLEFLVTPGLWEGKVRPMLPPTLELVYATGKAHLAAGDLERTVEEWEKLVEGAEDEGAGDFQAWVALRIGEAWGDKGEWGKAIESYREALKATENPLVQVAVWAAVGAAEQKRNELEDAENALESVLKLREARQPESLGVAKSLNKLGEVAYARGALDHAREYFLRALRLSEHLAPQSNIVAFSLNNLGVVAQSRGELDRAEDYLLRALRIHEQLTPWSLIVAQSVKNLGLVALVREQFGRAKDYFLRALQMEEQLAPQSITLAYSLQNLGVVAQAQGDLEGANDYHLRALQIREQLEPQGLNVADSLNNLGIVAWRRGDLVSAHDYHFRALQIVQKVAPQSLSMTACLSGLGIVAAERGDLDEAGDFLLSALRLHEQRAPQSRAVSKTLNNLGNLAQDRGDLRRAQIYFLQALRINEQVAPRSLGVAINLTNLGLVAQDLGDFDSANNNHLQALRIHEHLAPQSLMVASSLANLGLVAQARGNLARASSLYEQARAIEERLAPKSLQAASNLDNLGSVARARGDLALANDSHLKALIINEHIAPGSLAVARSLNQLGLVARASGDLARAHGYYNRALDALEHQVSKLGGSYRAQASFRSQHGDYYRDILDLLLAQNRPEEAFQVLERFRAHIFLTMLAERDVAFTADVPADLDRDRRRVAVLYDRTLKELAEFNPRDHVKEIEASRKELQKLDDEAGDIEARIRSASPKLAALRYPQPLDAKSVQQALDQGTLLLSFSVSKDRTALYALSRTGALEVKSLPLGEETLQSRVRQMLSLTPEARGDSSLGEQRRTQLQAISRLLYAELLGPLADRIAASERLLILPDGPLHALPFAELVRDTKDGPQYLAAWKPLHVALSATVYSELKQGRHPAGDKVPLQLAAFGDPIYPQSFAKLKNVLTDVQPANNDIETVRSDPTVRGAAERGLFDFQPLSYSRHEVLEIATLFPAGTARTFLGPDALEEKVKNLDPNTRILHLAAHGSTDEHLPSGSFIALTIPEEAPYNDNGPQRDNGLLQVWEIFERVRLNADLVVLSACDTALGEELGGEGLIGLTRAFQYAGARTVLASLWKVNDQATSELMIRFYKHLRAGLPKDQALQAAQRELIAGSIEVTNEKGEKVLKDFSSPYYWAGFQLYGDWQ